MSLKQRREDEYFMQRAISLAWRGTGHVSPNPRVGCVLVKEGHIVAEGYHQCYGSHHAEVEALRKAGSSAQGATAYVTLEPCSHWGKTPPCAPQLVKAGLKRVVIGMKDPHDVVNGRGIRILQDAGVPVEWGILEEECKWLNRGFIRRVRDGRPWVTLKTASTLDGRVAMQNGESQWITGESARTMAHLLRGEHDAIMIGVGTVLHDNPSLTVRYTSGKSPLRIILDTHLRTPLDAQILNGEGTVIIAGFSSKESKKAKEMGRRGKNVLFLPEKAGKVDLQKVMCALTDLGVNMVLVEGGATLTSSLLAEALADEISLFIAPSFMGQGISAFEKFIIPSLQELIHVKLKSVTNVSGDLWVEGVLTCSPAL